ncbi:Ig-like domain-containing protein [Pseudoalteromonas sp. C2R02]|uniref:Ig-like domain-containing protein n=1 Tax=Pseudoalteromonas sp. C2R02 TaxID=2841565 RepID=UPI001C09074F|nr:Ig-like domain-containing protein [Pseudoalteromonas sp. C2R02]MBU2968139.1 Ig-like domain-containing protein [Pseudoalteromonas sp. C2R02]
MRTTKLFFSFLACLFLTACNGSSGENEEPDIPDPDAPIEISLSVLDENCQILTTPKVIAGNSFCIQAKLIKNNLAVTNTSVNFSAPTGTISPPSTLSDENGIAQVMLNSDITDVGSNTITASVADVSASADYEFLESNEPDPNAPVQLSLEMLNAQCNPIGLPSFTAGDTICVKANLTKNESPVSGLTVVFDAPLGTLRQSSKLTDTNGNAIIYLDSDSTSVGAATLTATQDQSSANAQYEFINNDSGASDLPKINVQMQKNGIANNQFKQGESVLVQIQLTNAADLPLNNQIINLTAESGILDASAILTNQDGTAKATLSASTENSIGAAVLTASYTLSDNSQTINQQFNYQILDADIIEQPEIKAGYFDENNLFIEGKVGFTLDGAIQDGEANLSAGGTLGLKIAIVDENNTPISTPTAISFTSSCVANQQAQVDEQVLTINGKANATYEDLSCAGSTGNTDQIIATIAGSAENITLTQIVKLQPESLGAVEFVSAEPDSIVLKGTGGQGKQEISTLSFLVKGKLGNPLAQQQVTFELDTQVGGLSINPVTAFTNSLGQVSTKVTSGNVPTVVRVSASATSEGGEVISTQSDLLSVNTGLADQNSISLSAVTLNPESHAINGVETQITAWLADSFNNPVPDGTTVNFTTEGGQIEPSCQTLNGSCFVKWESSNPRVFNHRITILATALGHETFFDTNGNNIFDDADVNPVDGPIVNPLVSSGFGRSEYFSSSFIDMPEAWRDDNEDSIYQTGEIFIDYDLNGEHTEQDTLFNGPHCEGTNCSSSKSVNVRKAIRLVMASGASTWALYEDGITLSATTIASNNSNNETIVSPTSIARNNAQSYTLAFADTALQTLAIGSIVTITSDEGELVGQTSFTVSNNSSGASKPISDSDVGNISIAEAIIDKSVFGGQTVSFVLKNTLVEDDPATVAVVEVEITSPSGITSGTVISIPLD